MIEARYRLLHRLLPDRLAKTNSLRGRWQKLDVRES